MDGTEQPPYMAGVIANTGELFNNHGYPRQCPQICTAAMGTRALQQRPFNPL
jgi:hypothetical protein